MKLEQRILENYPDEQILLLDGFDDAFIGIGNQFNKLIAIYDRNKCIEVLEESGMDVEGAIEYFEFNIQSAYVGEGTPIFLIEI